MRYLIDMTEASYAKFSVEAESKEAAEQKMLDAYLSGAITWSDTDIEISAQEPENNDETEYPPFSES